MESKFWHNFIALHSVASEQGICEKLTFNKNSQDHENISLPSCLDLFSNGEDEDNESTMSSTCPFLQSLKKSNKCLLFYGDAVNAPNSQLQDNDKGESVERTPEDLVSSTSLISSSSAPLFHNGSSVNSFFDVWTPLHHSLRGNPSQVHRKEASDFHARVLTMLLHGGTDVNARGRNRGEKFVHRLFLVKMLLRDGSKVNSGCDDIIDLGLNSDKVTRKRQRCDCDEEDSTQEIKRLVHEGNGVNCSHNKAILLHATIKNSGRTRFLLTSGSGVNRCESKTLPLHAATASLLNIV